MKIACEHCGSEMTKGRGRGAAGDVSLVKGVVAIRENRCEATCSTCGKDSRLPFQFVVTVPPAPAPIRRRAP